LTEYVLTSFQCGLSDGVMERIGGNHVHRLNLRIGEDLAIIAGGARNSIGISEFARHLFGDAGDRRDFHIAQPTDSFRMRLAHETSTDESGLDLSHDLQISP